MVSKSSEGGAALGYFASADEESRGFGLRRELVCVEGGGRGRTMKRQPKIRRRPQRI